ncbi:MucB/RseB C-terminal domain-containing protein [Rheinheimera maricola]|uniref:MucB/RseB C-terminal domain-containing protein n=1 Tax=Rheinheimera maricola TaxID=2793282 RepID=A0ABS7X382_9GAMM|nr:MucB/RseB C-terminal domain-containing protein [Rheinheimera maricola]MBZ9610021.1 MucB/RseB C-terminal domain-containing protein [Rheinheimera maricola]
MRFSGLCSAIVLLMLSGLAQAEQSGWALFDKVQTAVRQYNFDTSFVVLKGGKADTYRWIHGRSGDNEIEHLIPLDTNGVDILRRDAQVYYLLTDRPAFVTEASSIAELPALLFEAKDNVSKLYNAVAGSSSVMSGRSAQLLRLTAKDSGRYHYWLWLDDETGFPLRIDTLSEQQNALERWLVTHMQITAEFPDNLNALMAAELPPAASAVAAATPQSSHQLNWMPQGYQQVSNPADIPQLGGSLLSYWLLSDGLHQVSVFVQNAQRMPTQAYRDGATTIYVETQNQLEITVIGPVSIDTARQLAGAVR